jgi:hypothetical protein
MNSPKVMGNTARAQTEINKGYYMGRINDSGNILETLFNRWGRPIEE